MDSFKSIFTSIKASKASSIKLYNFLIYTVVVDVLNLIKDFEVYNSEFDESIESITNSLLEDIREIELTYKSKPDILKKWYDWSLKITNYGRKLSFDKVRKNDRRSRVFEETYHKINLIKQFETFIERKDIKPFVEGTGAKKTESYVLNFNEGSNKLDRDFYNFFDSNSKLHLDWLGLSSGNKAYLNLFSLLRYELKNTRDENAIICIDEGDLYLHPRWQADFFYKLVTLMPQFKEINYQFVLTSHSPFLASDLPKQSLVFLGGNSQNFSEKIYDNDSVKTFGGNLGELYIDAFFMDGGLISRFAESKIKDLVDKINRNKKLRKNDRLIIDMIGEELITTQIKKMLDDIN